MITATTKRYTVCREEDTSFKDKADHALRRMRMYMWDSVEKKELLLPPYPTEKAPTLSDLMDFLEEYCDEMNDKHEDDLLYLNIVKDYTNE